MAIPATETFEALLGSLRVLDRAPGAAGTRQLPSLPTQDEAGRIALDAPLCISYDPDAALGFGSLLSKVEKELAAREHRASEELALYTLALAYLAPAPSGGAVARLNRLLDRMKSADVSLYLWFTLPLPERFSVSIPPFRLGPTPSEKLRYQCARAGSDYYERYAGFLNKSSCIERSPARLTILDVDYVQTGLFDDTFQVDVRALLPRLQRILDGYFGYLNGAMFADFLPEFSAAQDVTVSLGAPYVDPSSMLGLVGHQQVAIFTNFGKHGFVAPRGPGPIEVDLAQADHRVAEALHELRERFDYTGAKGAPINATIGLFCSFVARAKRHWIARRRDEALLHAVIAMELVFAERATLQRSVAERVAVITHQGAGRTFGDQKTWIEAIYDVRSRYVHAGRSTVDDAQLTEIFEVLASLTRAMLRAARTRRDAPDALDAWLAELDYLAKAYLAAKTPTAEDLAAAQLGPET